MMRIDAVIVAAALATAPLGGRAADLVVWWEKGFYAQADEAVAEIIAALKQGTRREVELAFHPQLKLPGKIAAALEAGQPPDFAFGTTVSVYASEWAFDNRLVDLTDTVGHFSDLFDSDAVAWWVLLNQEIGQKALMPCRWAARPTTSTSGRAYWSRRGSPSTTFRRGGTLLVVLVRPGPAGGARGSGPRRHLGWPQYVGQVRHPTSS